MNEAFIYLTVFESPDDSSGLLGIFTQGIHTNGKANDIIQPDYTLMMILAQISSECRKNTLDIHIGSA